MEYIIKYYDTVGGMFALPTYASQEIVNVKNMSDLDKYIQGKKDHSGFKFKKENLCGFNYISKQGAVKVSPVKIKEI